MAKKPKINFGQVMELIEKIYKDGGSTDETWNVIVDVYKDLHPDEQLEQLSKLEDCDPDVPIDDIPAPTPYHIDHDAAEICIGGCLSDDGSSAFFWTHFDEIRNAVLQIRRECKMPGFPDHYSEKDHPLSFLDTDEVKDKQRAFSIPSDYEGGITVASTAKLEEMKNEVKLLEASENLHLAKIRCLEKRIIKLEK